MSETYVAQLRKEAKLAAGYPPNPGGSLRGLAEKAGISPSTLSRFLRGGVMASDNLEKLEKALNPFYEPKQEQPDGLD